MLNPLAIVIPAYKLSFFDEALKSIAAQTNKNFAVYIGDDCSPEDLTSIVSHYENQFNIVYQKFPENLGHISIVKHWERCVEMTKGEEWIWIFSDDDIMSADCVELFLQQVQVSNIKYDVYRFNCSIINERGENLINKSNYPEIQSSLEFLCSRLKYQYHSYVVNCIFSRSVFDKYNGFVDFTAAWAADDATWILFGEEKKIFTLTDGQVKWRQSSINISGNTIDPINRRKKYEGTEQYIQWLYKWARRNKVSIDDKLLIDWFFRMLKAIGFSKINLIYLKSKAFHSNFRKANFIYQLKYMRSNFLQ